MACKRLFIATFVEKYLFERHYPNIQKSFAESCHGKWSELKNLHFTYKFLGNVDEDKIPEITEILQHKLIEYPGIIKFNGLGAMQNPRNPRMLYARVYSPDKSVLQNYLEIEKLMVDYGFPKEKGKFMSHVSLLRIKGSNEDFLQVYETNKDLYIGKQQNYKINLISSILTQDGPIYEILK